MKKILILFFICSAETLLAQHPDFRVEKITETHYWGDTTVNVKNFSYVDGQLNTISDMENGKLDDVRTLLYKKETVTISSQHRYNIINAFVFKDGALQSFKGNAANTFTITKDNGRISMITHGDRCNHLDYEYRFAYNNTGRISAVNLFPTVRSTKPSAVYKFVYNDKNQLERVDETGENGVYRVYAFTYEENKLARMDITFHEKFERGYAFTYDANGNIIEQKIFAPNDDNKAHLASIIAVTYAKEKGNDAMLWDLYDWKFTLMFGTRTYVPIFTPCY